MLKLNNEFIVLLLLFIFNTIKLIKNIKFYIQNLKIIFIF
jgi:hypothetical protein